MGRDPKLGRLKIILGRLFFCKHLQGVKFVESNNKLNAAPLHSSQPLLHFGKRSKILSRWRPQSWKML